MVFSDSAHQSLRSAAKAVEVRRSKVTRVTSCHQGPCGPLRTRQRSGDVVTCGAVWVEPRVRAGRHLGSHVLLVVNEQREATKSVLREVTSKCWVG